MYTSHSTREERIREYAYMLWEWRRENNIEGDALADWLQAEYQIDRLISSPVEIPKRA